MIVSPALLPHWVNSHWAGGGFSFLYLCFFPKVAVCRICRSLSLRWFSITGLNQRLRAVPTPSSHWHRKIKQSQNQIKAARGHLAEGERSDLGPVPCTGAACLAGRPCWTHSAVFTQRVGEPTRDCVLVAIPAISTGCSAGCFGCWLQKVAEYHLCCHVRTKLITFPGKTNALHKMRDISGLSSCLHSF